MAPRKKMVVRINTISVSELIEMLTEIQKQYDTVDLIVDATSRIITLEPVIWERIEDDKLDGMIT